MKGNRLSCSGCAKLYLEEKQEPTCKTKHCVFSHLQSSSLETWIIFWHRLYSGKSIPRGVMLKRAHALDSESLDLISDLDALAREMKAAANEARNARR